MADSCALSSDTDEADWEKMMEGGPSRGGISDTDEENGEEKKEGLNSLMRLSAPHTLSTESDPQGGPGRDDVVQRSNRR